MGLIEFEPPKPPLILTRRRLEPQQAPQEPPAIPANAWANVAHPPQMRFKRGWRWHLLEWLRRRIEGEMR